MLVGKIREVVCDGEPGAMYMYREGSKNPKFLVSDCDCAELTPTNSCPEVLAVVEANAGCAP